MAAQRAQTSLLALWGYIGGNFFWKGMKWGEVRRMDRNHLSLSVSVLIVPPQLLLMLFLNWNSQTPNNSCKFHSDMDKLMRGYSLHEKTASCLALHVLPANAQMTCSCLLEQYFFKTWWSFNSFQPWRTLLPKAYTSLPVWIFFN